MNSHPWMPTHRHIPRRPTSQLRLGERPPGARRRAEHRHELGKHLEPSRALTQRGRIRLVRHTDVDAHADRDPVDLPLAPSCLDEDACQLPAIDEQVVRPLQPDRLVGVSLEYRRGPESEANRQHPSHKFRPLIDFQTPPLSSLPSLWKKCETFHILSVKRFTFR